MSLHAHRIVRQLGLEADALLLRHGDKMAENARVDWLDKLVGSYDLSNAIANKNLSALFQSWIDAQDAYLPTKVDLYA